jgi:hypothetical protein
MMGSVEQSVECLAWETEVLRENLPHCRFVHHKSNMTWEAGDCLPELWHDLGEGRLF